MVRAASYRKASQRGKAKPKRPAALRSSSAALREKSLDNAPVTPLIGANPAVDLSRSISGILNAYMEFPGRLVQCRTPLGVMKEHALFAGRLLDLMEQTFAPERSR
jgi:hypothetical protein